MTERVFVFVDYENIRVSLEEVFGYIIDKPEELAEALKEAAENEGKWLAGKVYGDWSVPHPAVDQRGGTTAQRFERHAFESVMVTRKASGQDRTDMRLTLEAQKILIERADVEVFMIVAGDGDYSPLARAIKEAGRRVIICGVTGTISREMISIAEPFIPIERLLKLEDAPGVIVRREPISYNWVPFITALSKAEGILPFVGFKLFKNDWLTPSMGPVESFEDRSKLMNEAVTLGIAEVYKVDDPEYPHPTSAIRLNREHPLVKEAFNKIS